MNSPQKTARIVAVLLLLTIIFGILINQFLQGPIFEQYKRLSFLYFGFSIIGFAIILIDNISVLSILGLSQEYVKAEGSATEHFQALGTILYQTRWWTHYTVLLISCLPLFMFYYLFFLSKLIPRFISILGLIGVIMMLVEVLLSLFGQGIGMILFLPLGLVQIVMVIWLLIKGFKAVKL